MKEIKALVMLTVLMAFAATLAACATEGRRTTGKYLDDKTISAKVKTELATDPITKATEINVDTYNGVVQLSGFVTTQDSIRRAEDIARNTSGVRSVENNLILRSSEPAPMR